MTRAGSIALRLTAAAVLILAGTMTSGRPAASAPDTAARSPGLQLRYLGRDPATGMPAVVNDRFIAEVEHAVARYGKDESEPLPPPPAEGVDVARLAIPAMRVDATVARLGLDRYGRLDVPQDTTTVGWNPGFSALPGTNGATFFAAHVQYRGMPGVFARLAALRPGDEVAVALTDGTVLRYRVTSVLDYRLESIDMGALLAGREGVESLTLMTCSGPLNEGEFQWRTVVLAERVAD
ncbi:MAG: class F sortase [Dehalococcoidia bacterium]|nr:class F sortase [Dehalococcoidia bacterium]